MMGPCLMFGRYPSDLNARETRYVKSICYILTSNLITFLSYHLYLDFVILFGYSFDYSSFRVPTMVTLLTYCTRIVHGNSSLNNFVSYLLFLGLYILLH
jgi:hypothetical protein